MPANKLYESLSSGASSTLTIILLIFYVLLVAAQWKIFSKAGEPGWACLIPLYNVFVMFRVIYGSGLKCLLLLVPLLNMIVGIAMWIRLAQAFGKGLGFAILTLLFPNIFTLILGFGSAEYEGPIRSFI